MFFMHLMVRLDVYCDNIQIIKLYDIKWFTMHLMVRLDVYFVER